MMESYSSPSPSSRRQSFLKAYKYSNKSAKPILMSRGRSQGTRDAATTPTTTAFMGYAHCVDLKRKGYPPCHHLFFIISSHSHPYSPRIGVIKPGHS